MYMKKNLNLLLIIMLSAILSFSQSGSSPVKGDFFPGQLLLSGNDTLFVISHPQMKEINRLIIADSVKAMHIDSLNRQIYQLAVVIDAYDQITDSFERELIIMQQQADLYNNLAQSYKSQLDKANKDAVFWKRFSFAASAVAFAIAIFK